jgi:hypothetical protein
MSVYAQSGYLASRKVLVGDRDVLALEEAILLQALAERAIDPACLLGDVGARIAGMVDCCPSAAIGHPSAPPSTTMN